MFLWSHNSVISGCHLYNKEWAMHNLLMGSEILTPWLTLILVWLVPAHMAGSSMVIEHWKVPAWAPKIITPTSEVWTEKRVQALMWTWGDRTLPPTHKNKQDLKDSTRSHSQKQKRLKGSFEAHEFKTKERGEGPNVKFLQPPKFALFLHKDREA